MSETPEKLFSLAKTRIQRGELHEGMVLLEAALETAIVLHDAMTERRAWTEIGRVHYLECEPRAAWKAFAEVARCAERSGEEGALGAALARQAFLAYDAGDLSEAESTLDRVPPSDVATGMVLGYRGNIARSRGDYAAARVFYDDAIRELGGNELMQASFSMDAACVSLLQNDAAGAWRWLERAREHEEKCEPDMLMKPTVALYRSLTLWALDETVALADQAVAFGGDAAGAVEFFRRCHALLSECSPAQLLQQDLAALRRHCPPIEHARLTMKILRTFSGRSSTQQARLVLVRSEKRATLDGESSLLFSDASAEWRILLALAERRLEGGAALSVDALISCAWRGEKMLPKPARNRLHVALSGLRKKGLRELLLRDDDGYALGKPVQIIIM